MCSVAQRDLFSQACLCAEYPSTFSGVRAPFIPPPSKSRSYSCRLCALPPLPQTIVDARRTLPTWNDLPTSPRSSLSRLYGRACEFLLAETRGVGEDCWTCVQFAEHFARRAAAMPTCSVVLCWARTADSGSYAKGSDVAPRRA